ncbi:MAG: transcription elongation factor GreA [Clostridiales bacterium]|nr:transcription elongation factor GreA [Candidatus Crickella caballi]
MAVNNSNEMTRAGYEALNEELEYLITVVRKENAERLKEAISLGDISENAEYDAAKDAQAETEERINAIEESLRTAVIVELGEGDESDDTVKTGRTVTVKDLVLGIESTYQIVGTTEADPLHGKLSNACLVGQHLLGCKAGDVVEFQIPDGIAKYEVLEVSK